MARTSKAAAPAAPVVPPVVERTDLYCHECGKNFIAKLDMGLEGNHVISCPHCGHEHCRVIQNGRVTGDRWDSRFGKHQVDGRNVWKHDSLPARTTSASWFIYETWLQTLEAK